MDVLVNHSITLIEKLESLIGKEIDVFHYVFRCTLDIIYRKISKFLNVYKIYIYFYEFTIILLHFLSKDGVLDTQLNSLANQNCKVVESIEW